MAGKGRFRIPTLDEKDKAESCLQKGVKPLFKTTKESKSDDVLHKQVIPSAAPRLPASSNNSGTLPPNSGTRDTVAASNKNTNVDKEVVSKLGTANSLTKQVTDNKVEVAAKPTSLQKEAGKLVEEEPVESLPTLAKIGKTNSLIVNQRQRGNPILKHVRNIPWEYGNIVPDYVMGQSTCALFLSLRYHQLNPEYIHKRLQLLGKSFDLRVLLVQVDIKDPHHLLKDLAKMCILADCTLMLAFSPEEAGRYLETYKVYENKPPEAIMERTENNFMAKMTDCLTTVKSVNKTDCMTLMTTFGSLEKVMKAGKEELSLCPGFGPQKAQRLHDVFHQPFLKSRKRQHGNTKGTPEKSEPSPSKSAR
ncbi:DNA excision repair protein ERCC-1-like isoform X2 [Haliotis rubra]|uniref:DNA excision repair protein ERCC-1-like isoform X2 n=1 Tax=Haliotis rubra TaxID=36100 RepID=UPI001EE57F6C|nr:DNA excision repair protein ERCC-1-like isoform X2 [Haliotis rubra]